jgi:hypothetical protein
MVFVDRSSYSKYYEMITKPSVIEYLKKQYHLEENHNILVSNKNVPLIMGSVTKHSAVSMMSIAMFNLHLDIRDETEVERKKKQDE